MRDRRIEKAVDGIREEFSDAMPVAGIGAFDQLSAVLRDHYEGVGLDLRDPTVYDTVAATLMLSVSYRESRGESDKVDFLIDQAGGVDNFLLVILSSMPKPRGDKE